MFTRIFRRIKNGRPVVDTVDVSFDAGKGTATPTDTDSGLLYAVTVPGEPVVMLRAANQTEVRAQVRDAHGMKRLPSGTTVERVDS